MDLGARPPPIKSGDTVQCQSSAIAVAADLVLHADPSAALAPKVRLSRLPMAISLGVAALLHASLGCALIAGDPERHGAGGVDLDAVSVEVVVLPARALESRIASASSAAAAQSAIDQHDGASMAPPPAAEAEPPKSKAATETSPPEPKRQEADEPTPDPPPVEPPPLALLRTETPHVTSDEQTPPDAPPRSPIGKAEKALPPEQQASPPSAPAGGAASLATEGAKRPAAAAAIASAGAVRAFARNIVDALASTRPKRSSRDPRGTVRVTFAIAEDGGLEFVRIARSSGNGMLDEAALAAVRKATLPAPPPGLTLPQRTFVMPYYFR